MITNFYKAIGVLLKDKTIFLLATVPVIIGVVLYYFLGSKLYQIIMIYGQDKIKDVIGDSTGAGLIYGVLFVFFMAILFFIVNWTFILVVSILAAPFNDAMSTLVEKRHTNLVPQEGGTFSIKGVFQNIFKTIWNEFKKVFIILALTCVAAILSFIPFLAPIGFLVSALLLAIQFIDYSWARHQWTARRCMKDSMAHVFSYTFGGGFFMLLMAIPGINLFALSIAVIYFTLLWASKNPDSSAPEAGLIVSET